MTSNKLKMIAIFTMLIDHIGYVLFPEIILFRIVGRIAFPIFTFLIAEGYCHTRDVKKYMSRLALFAIISEIPFDLAFHMDVFYWQGQNIFFTLLLGLLAIDLYDRYKEKNKFLGSLCVLAMCIISFVFKTDYYVFGVLIIFTFYRYRNHTKLKLMAVSILLIMLTVVIALSKGGFVFENTYQIASLLSLGFIHMYNNKPGIKLHSMKYLLYAFYPTHIVLLYLVKVGVFS